MTKRILLAGILGGIAMFVWASLAHMVLPLGQTGIKEIPNEAAVLSAMRSSLGEKSGFYMFPALLPWFLSLFRVRKIGAHAVAYSPCTWQSLLAAIECPSGRGNLMLIALTSSAA